MPLLAMMHQHVQAHILAHPHGQVGIDNAHQRHVRQLRLADRIWSTPAPSENTAFRFGKPASTPSGGSHANA
jgi:hypothetical protein